MKSLTLEQQTFVNDNHNLIYDFAKKRNLQIEEYYDLLAIGLCKAARTYDSNIGKFSTYAYQVMGNEVNMYWEHISAEKRIPEEMLISGDKEMLSSKDSGNNMTLFDTIESKYDVASEVLGDMQCDFLMSMLTDKERLVVSYIVKGLKQKQIAEILGCSQQNISNRILKNVKIKWSTYL